jgi:plastocyanin
MARLLLSLIFSFGITSYASDMEIIELGIKNNRFEPEEIHAKEGAKIKILITNHDDTIEEFESVQLNREKIVPPKKTVTIVLAPLKAGEYKFEGEFHPSTAKGKLIISNE